MALSAEHVASALRSRGLKATAPRVHVLSLIAASRRPVGVPELLEEGKLRGLDTVTMYRSVETLADAKLLRRVDLRHGHTDYEFLIDADHHHHLICETCGRIEEIEWCPDSAFQKRLISNSKHFRELTEHAIEFFGICKTCAPTK